MLIRETIDGRQLARVACDVPMCIASSTPEPEWLAVGRAWGERFSCEADGSHALCPEHQGIRGKDRQMGLAGGGQP